MTGDTSTLGKIELKYHSQPPALLETSLHEYVCRQLSGVLIC